jgi:hypothetical protein
MPSNENKLATSLPDGAHRLGVGLSTMKLLLARGDVQSVRIGRRRLVLISSLSDYLTRLASE